MSILHKQVFLSLVFSFTIITSMIFSMWSGKRLVQIYETMNEGAQLQIQSREIMSLMKDIVFDLFAPQEYGQLRNLTYAPRSIVTISQWKTSVDLYRQRFRLFMNSPGLRNINNSELEEQRDTALILNARAVAKLKHMEDLLKKLKKLAQKNTDNLYSEMQKNAELIPFFSELQKTSYYFTNSFESFMNHFQSSLQSAGEQLVRGTFITFLSVVVILGLFSMAAALFISRDIVYKLGYMEKAFSSISRGDFSIRMTLKGNDEFVKLSDKINDLVATLQENIDNILNLTRDLGTSISNKMELEDIAGLITKGILQDTTADGTAVFMSEKHGTGFELYASGGEVPLHFLENFDFSILNKDINFINRNSIILNPGNDFHGYIMIIPLKAHKIVSGFLVVYRNRDSGAFTDLGIVRLKTFSEYVSLAIDNYFRYVEILEKQDAEYLALQAQAQPHFLYNVLSSFIGLNRMGDTEGLENAITALRDMLRYLQNRSRETTIGDELYLIRKYFELQKIRFQERLSYTIDAEDAVTSIRIPRLLLQPLVENALIHGIEPLNAGGLITIKIKLEKQEDSSKSLLIEIFNTGNELHKDYSTHRGGIGLNNVTNRLKIAYPDSLFSILTPESGGTLVRIVINNPKGTGI